MNATSLRRTASRLLAPAAMALALMLTAATFAQSDAGWPRTFNNADGTTTVIPAQPKRVLSTAVSVTGTLLAIDAPVVASGGAANGNFFNQWASVAQERGVVAAWPAGAVDLEAAYAADPDLIVVSTSGADSALEQLAELQQIAPTIVVNYGSQTWQSLARQLSTALGTEQHAEQVLADFDMYVAEAKMKISVPAGKANIISFNGAGTDNPIAKVGGPHAEILTALGFTLEDPNPEWHTSPSQRADFVWAQFERLVDLTAETTFLLSRGQDQVAPFLEEPVLANMPSVKAGQVYGLGVNSFRIDYYSATEIVDMVVSLFGN